MNEIRQNPYAPPSAPVKPEANPAAWAKYDYPLATRWQRFAGSIIDAIVLLALILPVSMVLGVIIVLVYPVYIENDSTTFTAQIVENIVIVVMMIAIFLAVNGHLLANRGQTVGKLVMKTRIVSDDDELVPLQRLFLMRYLVIWLIGMIPVVGNLFNIANAVAIFRDNRKCIHDEICGTKVVMTSHPR